MKITVTAASRRDEILQRKADYEARNKAYEENRNAAYRNYEGAKANVFAPLEKVLRDALGADADNLSIKFAESYGDLIQVKISNSQGYGHRRDPEASLTWEWKATLNPETGEVKKESSSWSGLEATTMDQIEDLKKCVRQLEIINTLNWEEILNVSIPEYSDFVDNSIEHPGQRPNFEQELVEADIEEAIGQRVLIKGHSGTGRFYGGDIWYSVVRDSGSQYTIFEVSDRIIEWIDEKGSYNEGMYTYNSLDEYIERYKANTYRVRKTNFIQSIVRPVETMEY